MDVCFFMIFNIGIVESGFPSINAFIIYLVGNTVLIATHIGLSDALL